jgi:hypothetical protein
MRPTSPRASRPAALRRRGTLRAAIACLAVLQLAATGSAQGPNADPTTAGTTTADTTAPDVPTPDAPTPDAPTVALHYEDMLATEPATITIFFPRPAGNDWRVLPPVSDVPCLRVGRVTGSEPDQVLVIEADVLEAEMDVIGTNGDAAQATDEAARDDAVAMTRCHARLTLTFAAPGERWSAAAAVIVNRIDTAELPYTDLAAVMTSDAIDVPRLGAPRLTGPASLLTLTLHNPFEHAIRVRGVADPEGFAALVGSVHPHDPGSFDGTYATLEAITEAETTITVPANGDIAFALLLDPERRLADGSGTLTIRPAVVVARDGATFASPFPRVSVAWGNELP